MNRAQRRAAARGKQADKRFHIMKEPEEPDFSEVPLATMCQSIQLLINELCRRGIRVYDFDNKNKCVEQIQIIQGKVYFLAAEEDANGKE